MKVNTRHTQTPSPELERELQDLKRKVTLKEREIANLHSQLDAARAEIETLERRLSEERKKTQQEVARVQEEFKKQLEKERERARKEAAKQAAKSVHITSFHRYKVFLESTLALYSEIRGDRDLTEEEKRELITLLDEVREGARITRGILEGKIPSEILGIKGNGLLDVDLGGASEEGEEEYPM